MWLPDRSRLLKIRLHNQGEDGETVWTEDLGAALLNPAARYVRIANIPVLHPKPTYGDVIEVRKHAGGMFEWDRCGVDLGEIGTRILEDGGRWLAIIDYWPSPPKRSLRSASKALDSAATARDIAIEGLVSKKRNRLAGLAVPDSMSRADLVAWLHSLEASLRFNLLHPEADSA